MMDINKLVKFTKTLKVLYVEDNAEARESTKMILEEFFDDLVIAVDGEDAWGKFQKEHIDLIITDINMPRLNGLDMIKKIRQIDKKVFILILSAHKESGYFKETKEIGVDKIMLKPIEINQFVELLYFLEKQDYFR